jgi:hypothetical protein
MTTKLNHEIFNQYPKSSILLFQIIWKNYIYNLITDRNYVLVFSYFYPECPANHGKGGILYYFIKENEFKTKIDDTIKKILENR